MDTRLRVSDVGDVDVRNVQNKSSLTYTQFFSHIVAIKVLKIIIGNHHWASIEIILLLKVLLKRNLTSVS